MCDIAVLDLNSGGRKIFRRLTISITLYIKLYLIFYRGGKEEEIKIYISDILPTEKCSEKSTKLLLRLLCYTSRS